MSNERAQEAKEVGVVQKPEESFNGYDWFASSDGTTYKSQNARGHGYCGLLSASTPLVAEQITAVGRQ